MATGRPAFEGSHLRSLFARIAAAPPEAPAEINRAVPAELSRLILRLLARNPEDRPASAAEVAAILATIEQRRSSRRRWLVLAGAGAVVVTAGLASGLAAWLAAPAPPIPVKVTLELDEPATRLLLVHGDSEESIEVNGRRSLELPPGDYRLRSANRKAKRQPLPDRFVVRAGQPLRVRLRLVGEICQHGGHDWVVWAVAVSPRKGELLVLSAGNDRRVGVWDAGRPDKVQFLDRHQAPVRAVAPAPAGRTAAAGGGAVGLRNDLSIRLWDVGRRQQIGQFHGHKSWVLALDFSADGKRLVSGGADGLVYIWDLKKPGKPARTLKVNDGDGVYGVRFRSGGKQVVTAGGDGKVLIWDSTLGKQVRVLEGHTGVVRSVDVGPAGEVVSAGDDGTVRVWDSKLNKARILRGHTGAVRQTVFTPDGTRLLSAGADGTVQLWDVKTEKEIQRLSGHDGAVQGVACAADGRKAVSCGQDGTVRLWELPR
jgi:WD40 repeat protein